MDSKGPGPKGSLWQGVFLYLAAGTVIVLAGDAALRAWTADAEQLAFLHRTGGLVCVALGAALAGWLLLRLQRAEARREAALRERDQLARQLPAGMARIALDGRLLWMNACLRQWLGLPRDGAVPEGFDFQALVQPVDPQAEAGLAERLRSGAAENDVAQYRLRRVPGSEGAGDEGCDDDEDAAAGMPLLGTTCLIPASGDTPEHLLCVLQDLTDARTTRRALERSEARLQQALDGGGIGVWDWDLRRHRLDFAGGVERLLRYQGADFAHDFRLLPRVLRADRRRLLAAARHALASDEPFAESIRLLCFDGEYRWFRAHGRRQLDAQGRPGRLLGTLADEDEQRRDEERHRLAIAVVDNTVEGVVVTDAQSSILWVNSAFTRLLGYTEDELLGQTPRIFKSGRHDSAFYAAMWERLGRSGHWQGEIWNRRKNGEVFPEHMSLSAVRNAAGETTHYVCVFTDITEEKAQYQRLEFLAHNDPLTTLVNRSRFAECLDEAVRSARSSGEQMAVLLLNLDRFKDVNDSYGHGVGDQVLQHIARQVQSAMGADVLVGRLGGDELGVLARRLGQPEDAGTIAQTMIAAAADPWRSPEGFEVVAGASVGIALFPAHGTSAQALLQGAHAAVHGAKAHGRGAWCFFDEGLTAAARERLALEARLRLAMAEGHLQMHYQPQVDIASGRIVGAEALVRWTDPVEGPIAPTRFIPVAESTGLIGPLGDWVTAEVCRQGRIWLDAGLLSATLALNLSPRQFHLSDLVAGLAGALHASGFPARQLELEITEGALAERPEEARQVLLRLRELGVRLAVDDFGTGYSSLAHLKRFPIDVLKIDRSFIRDLPQNTDDMAICTAIIAMGHSLGLSVLAEGVETEEQRAFLHARGCDSFQGYLCSRPLPAEEFTELLCRQASVG
ncbi:EAL domain-containing protein [Paracidovorax wautersii]|uniref:sensor domain-containing protein n=1 Tax=Paracidovorax wautersii TaxID=1177982 RepID=UPI0031D25738